MQDFVPSFEKVFSISMENATTCMAPLLSGLHWRVETVDAPILWTCDRPVMPWRPPSAKDRYEEPLEIKIGETGKITDDLDRLHPLSHPDPQVGCYLAFLASGNWRCQTARRRLVSKINPA
jgi:hypothetical protein